MATSGDFSSRVLEASEAGEKFVDTFYESMDKRRNVRSFQYWQLMCSFGKITLFPPLWVGLKTERGSLRICGGRVLRTSWCRSVSYSHTLLFFCIPEQTCFKPDYDLCLQMLVSFLKHAEMAFAPQKDELTCMVMSLIMYMIHVGDQPFSSPPGFVEQTQSKRKQYSLGTSCVLIEFVRQTCPTSTIVELLFIIACI